MSVENVQMFLTSVKSNPTLQAQLAEALASCSEAALKAVEQVATAAGFDTNDQDWGDAISQILTQHNSGAGDPVSQPVVMLFVAAALIFIPSVFKTDGATLGLQGNAGPISGPTDIGST